MKSFKARAGTWLGAFAAMLLVTGVAAPAAADTEPLKRSIENLTQFPFDVLLAPVSAGRSIYNNLNDIEDSTAVRIAYPVPGFFWNTLVNVGAGILRGVTGIIELPVGIGLAFMPDAEFDPLFDPAEDNEALYEWESDYYRFKIGVDYTTTY